MIIGTFNGWSIVQTPTTPGFRTVNLVMSDSIGQTISPFSQQSYTQQWAGADLWTGQVSLPPMLRSKATAWIAFLAELRGKLNVFALGDPLGTTPAGNVTGSNPVVTTSDPTKNLPGSTTLYTQGWIGSAANVLLPGDYIQLNGNRLHMVLDPVSADSGGFAQINLWPSIREAPTGNVVVTNCTGLFRLADNQRQWSQDYTRLIAISFKVAEAR